MYVSTLCYTVYTDSNVAALGVFPCLCVASRNTFAVNSREETIYYEKSSILFRIATIFTTAIKLQRYMIFNQENHKFENFTFYNSLF